MLRLSLFFANLAWAALLAALVARDFATPISTYSSLRYALIAGGLVGWLGFNGLAWISKRFLLIPSPYTGRGRGGVKLPPNLIVLLFAIGLLFIIPVPYALHHTFGAQDVFPYSVGAAALLFMLAGGLALRGKTRREVLAKFGAVLFGIAFAFLLAEAYVRLTYFDEAYILIQPDMKLQFTPLEGIMPGVEGTSFFTTDHHGIRTTEPYDTLSEETYKILTIGGSTTEVLYLDDSETWQSRIQALGRADGRDVWVGSVGRAGDKAVEHYFALRYFVPQYKFDLVIMMIGINDVALVLRNPESERHINAMSIPYVLDHPNEQALIFDSFYKAPYHRISAKTGIAAYDYFVREIEPLIWREESVFVEDQVGSHYQLRRDLWQKSPPVLDELPAVFEPSLATYRENLEWIIEEAARQGIPLVLVNQPTAWSADMPPEFEQYLWLIQYGDRLKSIARYTLPVMIEAMARYNAVMAQVCAEHAEITCVDLASQMNGDTTFFYDDVHFNEAGARRVGELIWNVLKNVTLS